MYKPYLQHPKRPLWDLFNYRPAIYSTENGRGTNQTGGNDTSYTKTSKSLGKVFWQFESVSNVLHGIGVMTASHPINLYLSYNTQSLHYANTGIATINGVSVATGMPTWVAGDVIDFAWDIDADRMWIRVNGGAWNAGGDDDPETGVDGIDTSTLAAGPYFIAQSRGGATTVIQTRLGGHGPFRYGKPLGYGAW